ncbi:MAG: hypothetical protein ACWGQW_14025 [bacterium]
MFALMDNIEKPNDVNLRHKVYKNIEFRFDRKDPYGMIEITTDGNPPELSGSYTSWDQAYRAAETWAKGLPESEPEAPKTRKVQLPNADAALAK